MTFEVGNVLSQFAPAAPAQIALVTGCLLPCAGIAWTDVKLGVVPDRLSLPVLLAGLASAPLLGRLPEAFLGAALGFGLLLVPCLLDLAGGGDLKCAAALGAWCGPEGLARVLLAAVLCGALWAAAARLRRGELRSWLAVLFQGLLLRVFCGVRGAVPLPKLEEEGSVRNAVPFGACMCLAVWLAWAWGFLAGGGAIGAVFADYFGR